jgi:hypothetical protein
MLLKVFYFSARLRISGLGYTALDICFLQYARSSSMSGGVTRENSIFQSWAFRGNNAEDLPSMTSFGLETAVRKHIVRCQAVFCFFFQGAQIAFLMPFTVIPAADSRKRKRIN